MSSDSPSRARRAPRETRRRRRSSLSAPEGTIVGIAADAHSIKVNATNVAELYRALSVEDFGQVFLVARARGDVTRLPAILREAAMVDPRVIPTTSLLAEDFDRRMSSPRIAGAIAGGVGGLTLLLACIGIFGVVSYGVALRTKEIGIRVALGARPVSLLGSIVRQVLTPVGCRRGHRPDRGDSDRPRAVGRSVLPAVWRSDRLRCRAGDFRDGGSSGGVVARGESAARQSGRRAYGIR